VTVSPAGDFEAFVEELGEPTDEKLPPTPPSESPDAAATNFRKSAYSLTSEKKNSAKFGCRILHKPGRIGPEDSR
jgi:hypothetical protein